MEREIIERYQKEEEGGQEDNERRVWGGEG